MLVNLVDISIYAGSYENAQPHHIGASVSDEGTFIFLEAYINSTSKWAKWPFLEGECGVLDAVRYQQRQRRYLHAVLSQNILPILIYMCLYTRDLNLPMPLPFRNSLYKRLYVSAV